MGQFEPLLVIHHPDHHLRTITAALLVLAPLGLGIGLRLPLKMSVGQVVEQDRAGIVEMPGLLSSQVRLQLHLLAQQRIAHVIETVGVPFEDPFPQQLGQRGAGQPIPQRVLAQRLD